MKKTDNTQQFRELSAGEAENINGGESFWYWPAYILGAGTRFIEGALENPPNLPTASQYK